MPPYETVNVPYFTDLITGKKIAMKENVVNKIHIPFFKELSVNYAISMCQQDPVCWKYVPEHWSKPKTKKDRAFLFAVLSTIRPDFMR